MSANLALPTVTGLSSGKEAAIDTAFGLMDAMLTEQFNADVNAGNVVLTNAQYRQNALINIINAGTAGRTVTVPAIKRAIFIYHKSGANSVSLIRGTTTIVLTAGATYVAFTDGTANGLTALLVTLATGGYVAKSGDTMTGPLQVPAGLVSAPGLQLGDADTGFYQTSAQIHAAIDGVEIWRATATGIAYGAGFDPTEALHSRRTGATANRQLIEGENAVGVTLSRNSADAVASVFIGRKSRGTVAAQAVVVTNDNFFQFNGQAYDGAAYKTPFFMIASVVAATPSATDMESTWTVSLAAAGAATGTELLKIRQSAGLSLYANVVIDQNRQLALRAYTNAAKPAASANTNKVIFITDYLGGLEVCSDGTDWVVGTDAFIYALSDESSAITTGVAKLTARAPYKAKIVDIRSNLNTVSSSGLPTVDINVNGSTILSTKLTIDATEKTSKTAAAAYVASSTALADDDELTFDIDVAGTGAKGLKVSITMKHIL